jgi:pimeloyl-ACP methyl ester carboxylesterase
MFKVLAMFVLVSPVSPVGAGSSPLPPLEGAWEGALKVGAIQLRLVAKIKRAEGKWQASLDSVDQGAHDIPVDSVTVDGAKVTLSLPKLVASYEARLDGDKLVGTWTQMGKSLPLELHKTDHPVASQPKPQEPKRPLPYDELEVTVENKPAGVRLAGTLTKPRGAGRFPAVVLVTGSGPQDRDESLMGHKPFLVLADALTRKGIAVLRCDDRGTGKSTGEFAKATTNDFVTDALAAVAFLRARPDIDAAHVGLVGHSEGGLIAPMAAAQSKEVAFIVMLAGTGLPGEDILYLQQSLIAKAQGKSDAEIKKAIDEAKQVFAVVKAEKDDAQAEKKLLDLWRAIPEAERQKPENSEANVRAQIKQALSPWFRTFLTLDPRPFLKKVQVPVLALNGERDLQVPPKANLPEITKALAGNKDVTIKELPGLNHLFQNCKTGAPTEYAQIDETFSPAALDLVGDWIARHTRAK